MITNEDIIAITQNILSTMLELEANASDAPTDPTHTDQITGCVQISGEWMGAIVIQCPETLARTFSSRYLQASSDSITESDLRDVFAEMTNMIGGNIKGQVPAPSFLSIPSVTTGQDFDFHLSGAMVIRDLFLECDREILRVIMCEEDRSQSTRLSQRKHDSVG